MPFITYEGPALAPEQKPGIIARLTDAASEATGRPTEAFIVRIRELPLEDVGMGGRQLSSK